MLLDLATDTSGKKDSITMYEGKEDHINDSFTKCLMILSFMWVNVSKSVINFFLKTQLFVCFSQPEMHLVKVILIAKEWDSLQQQRILWSPRVKSGHLFQNKGGVCADFLLQCILLAVEHCSICLPGFCLRSFVSSKPVLSHSLGRRPFH